MRNIAILLSFFFLSTFVSAQNLAYESEASAPASFMTRWTNSPDGLRLRDKPSQDGKVLSLISFGTKLTIKDYSQPRIVVSGVAGNWIQVEGSFGKGWCFSGFVSTFDPKPVPVTKENFLGEWSQGGGSLKFGDDDSYSNGSSDGLWELTPPNTLNLVSSDDSLAIEMHIVSLSSNRLVMEIMGLQIVLYRKSEYSPSADSLSAE